MAQQQDLSRISPCDSGSTDNYGMAGVGGLASAATVSNIDSRFLLKPYSSAAATKALPLLTLLSTIMDVELFDAEKMSKKWVDLSEAVKACVDAEPGSYKTISTLAIRLIRSNNFHSGTATLNGLLPNEFQQNTSYSEAESANTAVGPRCMFRSQQKHNAEITVGDHVSVDLTVFGSFGLTPYYTTTDFETPLDIVAKEKLDSSQQWVWVPKAMLGNQLGDRLLYKTNSGIRSLWFFIEVVKINRTISTSSHRASVLPEARAWPLELDTGKLAQLSPLPTALHI
ncbi:hypothetical protein O988_06361 [Pseudogymnoascus sp. VKM F-3808]|nr:hypothetical protein O988_06361 [Pseudogymnoascus sp. VKM F-3808]